MTALEIVERLQNNGHAAYFVGGYVRGLLSGAPPKDIDISTSASPEEILDLFSDRETKLVGKSFGVIFVDSVEVATFRKDRYFGMSDKNVEITIGSLEDDAARRDLTINAMYFDPFTEKILDLHGGGADVRKKIVRFVGNPKERIFEDPNRIIRACRFRSNMKGTFDPDTFDALKNWSHLLETYVAPERVRLEIFKALEAHDKSSGFFWSLQGIGGLRHIFPSLAECYGVPGGKFHNETIFDHNMYAGDSVSRKYPLVKLAAYLHDVGKVPMKRINPDTEEEWFEGHAEKGAEILEPNLRELTFSNEEVSKICNLVKFHMRISTHMGPKAVRRLIRELAEVNLSWKELLALYMADRHANLRLQREDHQISFYKSMVQKFWKETRKKPAITSLKSLVVNGNDIMEALSIPPGPRVGEVLNYLLDTILENPAMNEREALIYTAKKNFLKES